MVSPHLGAKLSNIRLRTPRWVPTGRQVGMCDCLVALPDATDGHTTLFAKNSDRPTNEAQDVVWTPPRLDRSSIDATHIAVAAYRTDTFGHLSIQPRWMWGVEGGVNEAGVAIGNERITTNLDPRLLPDALTGMDLVRLALERAVDGAAAVETIVDLLGQYGQGGSGEADRHAPYWSSFLIADGTYAYKLDTSGRAWECEQISSVGAVSNRTSIASFDAEHRHPHQPVTTLVDPRLRCSTDALSQRPVTLRALRAWQRSHTHHPDAPGWSVCMHVTERGHEQRTTAAIIAELPDGETKVRQRARVWVTLGSPCRSVAIPITVGEPVGAVPPRERFARLDDHHRDDLDELQTWLDGELLPPDEAWREVTATLDRLDV